MKRTWVILLFGLILVSLFTALTWGAPGRSGDPANGTTDEEGLTNATTPPPLPLLSPPPPPPPPPDAYVSFWNFLKTVGKLATFPLHLKDPNWWHRMSCGGEYFTNPCCQGGAGGGKHVPK